MNTPDITSTAVVEQQPAAAETQPILTEKLVSEMSDAEIEQYYRENELASIPHAVMSNYQLQVVQRYGAIAAGRRSKAEHDAENATITQVRRNVQVHVDRYGTAQWLAERLAQNNARLSREDPGLEVQVTIHCNGVDLTMGFADIQAAYGQRQNSQTIDLNRKLADLLSLMKVVANQAKAKACKVDGRNYEAMCHDITWKNVLSNLNAEHNPE